MSREKKLIYREMVQAPKSMAYLDMGVNGMSAPVLDAGDVVEVYVSKAKGESEMSQRKPGDYVVNAELTDEQRERFVRDCVAAGALKSQGDTGERYTVMTVPSGEEVRQVGSIGACGLGKRTDVTHKYKENPMTQPQLMRQIADAMERNPEGWWREFERYTQIERRWKQCGWASSVLDFISNGSVRPKPRTYTLHVEDMPEHEHIDAEIDPADFTFLDLHIKYPDEPTAREALEKLTRAVGGGNE